MSSLWSDHACKYNSSLGRKGVGLIVTKINAQEISGLNNHSDSGGAQTTKNVFKNRYKLTGYKVKGCKPNTFCRGDVLFNSKIET